MENIRVSIVDDQTIFRQTLGLLITNVPLFHLESSSGGGIEFITFLEHTESLPDVVLLDLNMPGMNGIEVNDYLHIHYPQIKVIILSVHSEDRLIGKMISAGASAFLVKNCDKEELITAITTTYETGFYINKQTLRAIQVATAYKKKLSTNDDFTTLTNREKEILVLICKEMASSEIADKLFLSVRTVEGHRNNLLLKTESKNTAGLVFYALKHQLIEVF